MSKEEAAAEEWNRSSDAASKILGILRDETKDPAEGCGTLAMVLAAIANRNLHDPNDINQIAGFLGGFVKCFQGALHEIRISESKVKS